MAVSQGWAQETKEEKIEKLKKEIEELEKDTEKEIESEKIGTYEEGYQFGAEEAKGGSDFLTWTTVTASCWLALPMAYFLPQSPPPVKYRFTNRSSEWIRGYKDGYVKVRKRERIKGASSGFLLAALVGTILWVAIISTGAVFE